MGRDQGAWRRSAAGSIELWQDYHGSPLVPDATLKRWAPII